MSFTISFIIDAAGRLTRRKKVDDANPELVYNQQDFSYNQRNQVTQITNTVAGGLGTADATRAFGYHGDGSMVTLSEDPMAPTSYLAWCAGGRLGYERNDDDVALYRWGPTGLVEFSPPDPEHRSRRTADQWGHTTRLTAGAAQDQYWSNVAGEVLAKAGTIMTDGPPRNRVVNGRALVRLNTGSAQIDSTQVGQVVLPESHALTSGGPFPIDLDWPENSTGRSGGPLLPKRRGCDVSSISVRVDSAYGHNRSTGYLARFIVEIRGSRLGACSIYNHKLVDAYLHRPAGPVKGADEKGVDELVLDGIRDSGESAIDLPQIKPGETNGAIDELVEADAELVTRPQTRTQQSDYEDEAPPQRRGYVDPHREFSESYISYSLRQGFSVRTEELLYEDRVQDIVLHAVVYRYNLVRVMRSETEVAAQHRWVYRWSNLDSPWTDVAGKSQGVFADSFPGESSNLGIWILNPMPKGY